MDNTITLSNKTAMPMFGLGTYLVRSPEIISITETAIKLGYRLIDTAAVYRNEADIGQVLKKLPKYSLVREDIFVTSKLAPAMQGAGKASSAAIKSLKDLDLDYLDLYLIHWPGASGISPEDEGNTRLRKESWIELEQLYKEGKLKAIGVSNYTIDHLKELLQYCTIVPAVNQVELHPYLTQKPLRDFCKEHGIHVQAYSSLGAKAGCKELLADPVVSKIAQRYEKTNAQVLLRWALDHGISVIPKTTDPLRLKENMDIFDFSLNPEDIQELDNLNCDKHFCWDPRTVA